MQLAATQKGRGKRGAICSQIYQRRMQAEFIESGALRRVIAVYRAKYRLQPCEPKPRPAEARKTRPADFGTRTTTAPTEAELANLQRTLFLNEANVACGAASPATAEAASFRTGRLRLAQHCKLQKTISKKNDCKQRKPTNCKTAKKQRSNNRKRTTIFRNPPAPLRRQRTAESTNHTGASRSLHLSGCEVAESEDNKNRTNTNRRTPPAQVLQASKNTLRPTEPIAGKKRCPGD